MDSQLIRPAFVQINTTRGYIKVNIFAIETIDDSGDQPVIRMVSGEKLPLSANTDELMSVIRSSYVSLPEG